MTGLLALALVVAPPTLDEIFVWVEAGRLAQAEAALSEMEVPPGLEARIRGVIALQRGDFDRAARELERAERVLEGDPTTSLYLAHVYCELGRVEAARERLPATEPLAASVVAQPLVKARVLQLSGDDASAYSVLNRAASDFVDDVAPSLELVALSERLGLRAERRRWVERAFENPTLSRDEALALVDASYRDATLLPVLERLSARFSEDADMRGHLAHAYAAAELPFASARLFEEAVHLGGFYAFEAADQYRVSGQTDAALRMNALVSDQRQRAGQRLAILFAARRMARVLALEDAQTEWSSRDLYRFAYAHYALGNYARATALAQRLLNGDQDSNARELLDALERAR